MDQFNFEFTLEHEGVRYFYQMRGGLLYVNGSYVNENMIPEMYALAMAYFNEVCKS